MFSASSASSFSCSWWGWNSRSSLSGIGAGRQFLPPFPALSCRSFLASRLRSFWNPKGSSVMFRAYRRRLFTGAAMSVTAFPVLARILTERNLQKTQVGDGRYRRGGDQ